MAHGERSASFNYGVDASVRLANSSLESGFFETLNKVPEIIPDPPRNIDIKVAPAISGLVFGLVLRSPKVLGGIATSIRNQVNNNSKQS